MPDTTRPSLFNKLLGNQAVFIHSFGPLAPQFPCTRPLTLPNLPPIGAAARNRRAVWK